MTPHSRSDPRAEANRSVALLFDEHSRRIMSYLVMRTDLSTAEELLSETFTIALVRWSSFDRERDPLPWLWGIATNLLRRHWRQEGRALRAMTAAAAREVASGSGRSGDPTAADDRVDHQRALAVVMQELRRMRPVVRETVLLFAWAELSYEQIAAATDVPVGTVRSRINRARTQLRGIPNLPSTIIGDARA